MAGGRHFRARPHRTWWQRTLLTFGVFFTVVCLGIAGLVGYVYAKAGQLVRFDFDEVPVAAAPPGEPENYLIVGSDSRENVDPDDPEFADVLPGIVGGTRTDTIIIARVDPETTQVQMVSFPRDLWVVIADTGDHGRINTAYGRGRRVLIDTLQQNFGIEVNRYVEIDFTGFQRLTDAIDGVPLYFDAAYRDTGSGLEPVGPGCVTLSGGQALAFARSRHLQVRDGRSWRSADGTGDLGRIERQQVFIEHAMSRALALDITDLFTLNRLLDVAVDSVSVGGLSNDDLRDLARRFSSFDPNTIQTHTLPTYGFRTNGGASVLGLEEEEAQPILDVFRGLEPGDVSPSRVTVSVRNGTGAERQAADTAAALDVVGFVTTVAGDAPGPNPRTTVFYAPGSEHAGALVARHLTSKAVFEVDPDLELNEVLLVTGDDFSTVMRQAWPEEQVPVPTAATTTTTPSSSSSSTTTTRPTTTTTIELGPGEVPPGVEC